VDLDQIGREVRKQYYWKYFINCFSSFKLVNLLTKRS